MDIKPTPTGKIIVDFLNRKMPAYLDTGLNLIDVEDCARGHILAAEKGRIGEKYILGNENLTLREIFSLLEEISGLPAPKVRLPYTPILLAAYVNEASVPPHRKRAADPAGTGSRWHGNSCFSIPRRRSGNSACPRPRLPRP